MPTRTTTRKGSVLALLLLFVAAALAQTPDDSYLDPRLDESLQFLKQGRYVRVRETAEELLRENPHSYPGHYLLGTVYYEGEGNLPRAYHHLTDARQLLESAWSEEVRPQGVDRLHKKLMYELILVTGALELYQEQLNLLSVYDDLYTPNLAALYGWPLMKLGRIEEARSRMLEVLAGSDAFLRPWVLTTLGNIDYEAFELESAHEYYLRLLGEARANEWPLDPVYFLNLGEAARNLLQFEEAEIYLEQGTGVFSEDSLANPWRSLAELHAGAGRYEEAMAALVEMHRWQERSSPHVLQQKWAESLTTTALVLTACGFHQEALEVIERVLARPDRNAGTSSAADAVQTRTRALYQKVLALVAQTQAEEEAWEGMGSPWPRLTLLGRHKAAAGYTAALVARRQATTRALRPYGPGTLDCPWLVPSLREGLGAGVTAVAAARLLEEADREKPYFQAFLGEDHWLRGELELAEPALRAALDGLQPAEALLRARVRAVLGDSLLQQGRTQEGLTELLAALALDPSVTRRVGVALPLAGDAVIVSQLCRSPRFSRTADGLEVSVNGSKAVLSFAGRPVATAEAGTLQDQARGLHLALFGPALQLTQAQLRAAQGAAGGLGSGQRTELEGLFR